MGQDGKRWTPAWIAQLDGLIGAIIIGNTNRGMDTIQLDVRGDQ